MAYDIEYAANGPRREFRTHGTGTGTLYVTPVYSADGVLDIVLVWSTAVPSTTDTFAIGSEWTVILAGSVKKYLKTAATTWTVIGAQTA